MLLLQRGDQLGKGTVPEKQVEQRYETLCKALDDLLASQPVFTLKQLAVNGRDLLALGGKGKQVGNILNSLLEAVMDETLPNDKTALIMEAERLMAEGCPPANENKR